MILSCVNRKKHWFRGCNIKFPKWTTWLKILLSIPFGRLQFFLLSWDAKRKFFFYHLFLSVFVALKRCTFELYNIIFWYKPIFIGVIILYSRKYLTNHAKWSNFYICDYLIIYILSTCSKSSKESFYYIQWLSIYI